MPKEIELMVATRVPLDLLKQLDKAAKAARRSRSAELRLRLEGSFRKTTGRMAA